MISPKDFERRFKGDILFSMFLIFAGVLAIGGAMFALCEVLK